MFKLSYFMCVFSNGKDLLVFNVVVQYTNAVVTE